MSKEIDEKVVEMYFDNKDFEKNIKETMMTLDEFKKQLNFSGASEGLENISHYANRMNFDSLGQAVDDVKVRFSALEVIGTTALVNITNSAVNAGKKLAKALTIDNYVAGWNKYEQKTANVQTIMNATGKSVDEVSEYLDRLMWFSDETSYSFTDMTSALSTMTAKGGNIDKAIPMIWGIAEATAYAGKTSAEFTRVIRNLTQSYSAGFLNLMDWKSVELANVNSKQLTETLIEAGEQLGKIKKGEVTLSNFNEKLKDKWADTEVMEMAFGKWATMMEEAEHLVKTGEYENAAEAIASLSGKYEDYIEDATKAAQTAKTFTEAIDATKDAVSSAFMRMYESIFGNYEEAKDLWTDVTEALYNYIVTPINNIADRVDEIMSHNPFKPLIDNIETVTTDVKNIVKPLEDYGNIVDEIINGKWGNSKARWDALTEAGYDWAHAQNLVNEKLGSSVRHNTDFVNSQEQVIKQEERIAETTSDYIQMLSEMDDATLLSALGDQEKVDSVRALQREADKLGVSVKYLVDNADDLSGRNILIKSFTNIGETIITVFGSIKKAWNEIFKAMSVESIYNIIAGFHKLTTLIKDYVQDNAENLTRTMKGLFAVLDIIGTIVKGVLRVGFTALKAIMGVFGKTTSVALEATAGLGDALVWIRDILKGKIVWVFDRIIDLMNFIINLIKTLIFDNELLGNSFNFIKDGFDLITKPIKNFISNNQTIKNVIESVSNVFDKFKKSLKDISGLFSILTGKTREYNGEEKDRKTVLREYLNEHQDLKDILIKIRGLYSDVTKNISEFGNKIAEIAGDKFSKLKIGFENVGQSIREYISKNEKLNSIYTELESRTATLRTALHDIANIFTILIGKNEDYNGSEKTKIEQIKDYLEKNTTLLNFLEKIRQKYEDLKVTISNFGDILRSTGKDIMDGFGQGLSSGFSKIIEIVTKIANAIINKFKDIFDSHSPSKVFIALGGFVMSGLLIGLTGGFGKIIEALQNFGGMIVEAFTKYFPGIKDKFKEIFGDIKQINWDNINSILLAVSSLIPGLSFLNIPRHFFTIFKIAGVNSLEGLQKGLSGDNFSKVIGIIKDLASKVIETFKKILHIDSPSKVFIALGGFIMAGLAVGLTQGFNKIPTIFTGFVNKIVEIFKELNFGKLFGLFLAGGAIIVAIQVVKALKGIAAAFTIFGNVAKNVTAPLKGLGDALTGLGNMFTSRGKAELISARGNMVKNLAESILMIAAAMFILSKIDNLKDVTTNIAIISGIMVAMYGLLALISKYLAPNSLMFSVSINSVSDLIKSLGLCLILLAATMKILGNLSPGQVATGLFVITMFGALVSALVLFTSAAGNNADKAAIFISKIGIAFLALSAAMKILGNLSLEQVSTGMIIITMFAGIVGALVLFTSAAGNNADKAAKFISKIGIAFLALAVAMKLLGNLTEPQMKTGLKIITAFTVLVSALIGVTKLAGDNATKAGAMILQISAGFVLLALAMKILGNLTTHEMTRGIAIIAGFSLLVAGLIAISKFAGKDAHKAGLMIMEVSAGLLLLSACMIILGSLTVDEIKKGIAIIGAFTIFVGILIGLSKFAGQDADKAGKMILSVSGAIAILVGCLWVLTLMDQNKLIKATLSLIEIIGAFSVALFAMSKLSGITGKSIAAVITLGLIISLLVAGLSILEKHNLMPSLESIKVLSILLLSMSAALFILNKIQKVSLSSLGALAILGLVVGELGLILKGLELLGVQPSIETVTALSILLLGMSTCLLILSAVGMTGASAIIGVLNLLGVVTILGAFLAGLGLLNKYLPDIKTFIEDGGSILSTIGSVLGEFVGNIIAGIAGATIDLLPKIGEKLSEFMVALTPFLNGIKLVDGSTLIGASFLALSILEMTAANLISGISSFITGGHSLSDFAQELSTFMTNATPFFTSVSKISSETLTGVKNLADAILAITKAEFVQGINNFLGFGDKSLSGFGEQLGSLGEGLNNFVKELSDFGPEKVEIVRTACEAIKTLAEANKSIPNSGGLLSNIVGDNKLDTFGDSLIVLGKGINGFVTELKDFKPEHSKIIKSACEAIKNIAETNDKIPNTGGIVSSIIGDNDLADFGDQLAHLGLGLALFVKSLEKGFDPDSSPKIIETACNSIKTIASLNESISDSSWYSKIIGETDLEKFAKAIPFLGEGINNFVAKLTDFGTDKVQVVEAACKAITAVSELGKIDLASLTDNLIYFGISLSTFGSDINTFVTELTDVGYDSIEEGMAKVKEFIDMALQIAEVNIESLSTFSNSIVQIAETGVKGFCEQFSGFVPKQNVKDAVTDMLKVVIDSIENKKPEAVNKMKELCSNVIQAIKDSTSSMNEAGKYFVQGFVDGINENAENAVTAARNMALRAVLATKQAIDSNSPSKVTHELGNFFGEGFAIGIKDYFGRVYDTAYNTGDLAKEGLSKAISRISSIVEDETNTQPVIRPVLDLTDIENGYSYINSMFGNDSIGLKENLNSISNSFNLRNQNGYNLDLLDAINKLNNTIQNGVGNTTNIYTQELDSAKLDQIVKHVNKEFGLIY